MNKRIISVNFFSFILLILSILTFSCSTEKKEEYTPLKTDVDKQELAANIETEIPQVMEKAMIPGLSIAVIHNGELLLTKGFGVKNAETKEPVTEETIFEAASFSKPVYAYAVLKLVERGMLNLDRPLIEYVTDVYIEKNSFGRKIDDERFRKITARMVLTHTPGFPNWRGKDPLKINFEPGEKFSYSGEGFAIYKKLSRKFQVYL